MPPSSRTTISSTSSAAGKKLIDLGRIVGTRDAKHDPVVVPHHVDFAGELAPQFGGDGRGPRGMHARSKGSHEHDPPIADFVQKGLDDDRLIAGRFGGGFDLFMDVIQQIPSGSIFESMAGGQTQLGFFAWRGGQFACQLADRHAELEGPPGAVTVPEGHATGFAGSRLDEDSIVRDFQAPPGRGTEQKHVAGSRFKDHFLIEFADAVGSSLLTAGEKDSVQDRGRGWCRR